MASQTLRTLKLSLLADVSQFGGQLDKAGSSFSNFTKGVEKASGFANIALGVLGGLAASAVNAASDLEETSTAVEAVFGRDGARDIQDFARVADRSLGQSRQQALDAAQTFGIFGKAAGLTDDDLVDFTTTLTTLAGDLASFQNTTPEQAINALGAALRGESEPIRNYGVLLDAATIKNRALKDGLIETESDALDPATRTLAIYAELLGQTSDQQGNFADTASGFANTQRTFSAQMENFKADIGDVLLDILIELLPRFQGIIDTITSADPDKIVDIGLAIGKLAAGITTLNVALKGFAAVQAAAKFLFSTVGAVGLLALAGGSSEFERERERFRTEERERQGTLPTLRRSPGINPQTGFLRTESAQPIVVNGVVGSTYQVFRELDRQLAAGTRSAAVPPRPGAR